MSHSVFSQFYRQGNSSLKRLRGTLIHVCHSHSHLLEPYKVAWIITVKWQVFALTMSNAVFSRLKTMSSSVQYSCYSKCGPQTGSTVSLGKFRIQGLPRTWRVKACILTRSLGEPHAPSGWDCSWRQRSGRRQRLAPWPCTTNKDAEENRREQEGLGQNPKSPPSTTPRTAPGPDCYLFTVMVSSLIDSQRLLFSPSHTLMHFAALDPIPE